MYRTKRIDIEAIIVPVSIFVIRVTTFVALMGIQILVKLFFWLLLRFGKLLTYRTKTIRVDFSELIPSSAPTIVGWKRRRWSRKQPKVQIQLSSTFFSHPETNHFAEAKAFILNKLENARRIEVDYVPAHKIDGYLLIGEIYVDDVLLNLECIKRGYAEASPSVRGKEVRYIYRRANKKAAKKNLGIHSVPSYMMR